MTGEGLTHLHYVALAYGAAGLVLAALAADSLLGWRRAQRALRDAGLEDGDA